MAYRPSEKIRKLRRRKIMKKIFFHYFSPVFFFGAFLFLMYSWPFLHLQKIKITGTHKTNPDLILKNIQNELNGRYFYLLDRDHIFFYPKNKIKKEILSTDKRIKDLNFISKNWWQELEIQIIERNEKYLWCQKNKIKLVKNKNEECFYLDEEGIIFDLFTKKTTKDFIKFYGPLNLDNFSKLNELLNFLNQSNLDVKKVVFDDFQNFIIFLSGDTKLLFSADFNLKKMIDYLNIIFSYRDFSINKKEKRFKKKINYINLMFGKKIYYCLNNLKCATNY